MLFIYKISKYNNYITIETNIKIIQFPIYLNDNVNNLLQEFDKYNIYFLNKNFLKYCLNIFIKPKTRIISILNIT
jgi:hypothetical protein